MSKQLISLIYRLFLWQGGPRINSFEQHVGFSGDAEASEDDRRNIGNSYAKLFCDEGRLEVEGIYRDLIAELQGRPFEQCADILAGLAFLQEVVATALWKYRLDVGDCLETFARGFDRLDVPEERWRLHQLSQAN